MIKTVTTTVEPCIFSYSDTSMSTHQNNPFRKEQQVFFKSKDPCHGVAIPSSPGQSVQFQEDPGNDNIFFFPK